MTDYLYSSYVGGQLDPQTAQFLSAIAAAGLPSLDELTPELARERNIILDFAGPAAPVASMADRTIPTPYGDIALRIYTPPGKAPFPVLLFLHGGGWVVGTLGDFDVLCSTLCRDAGCIVVSVGYHLAPERKFPVAVEESYAALQWVAKNAVYFGGDPNRLAVAGDSAGGNMAAVLTMMARDRKGPRIAFQLLICPATNLSGMNNRSYQEFGNGIWLSAEMMKWYIRHYINSPDEAQNPHISPLLASDFTKLPEAFILAAEFDVLSDEAEAYAEKLKGAGVPVVYKKYPGQIHDFILFGKVMYQAYEAIADCCREIKKAFSR